MNGITFSSLRPRFDIWYLPALGGRPGIFGILLVAFALRVYHLDAQSIWWDEGHSIQMASAALAQIPTLPGMDVHPPGYFVLLHQWMAVAGRSEFALRYLSVIFGLLTVALVMRFARSLPGWPRAGMALAGGLAALSPLYVAYAQEVRMYAMVTFFALASVYFQWQITHIPPPPLRGRVGVRDRSPFSPPTSGGEGGRGDEGGDLIWLLAGYVLATAASLYTHYFTIFLLLFQNVAWLLWALDGARPSLCPSRVRGGGKGGRLATWLGSQAAVLLLFSPQLPLALRQTTAYANPNLNPPGVVEFLARSWLAYTVGASVDPAVGGRLAAVLAIIAGVVWLAAAPTLTLPLRGGGDSDGGVRGDWIGTTVFLVGWLLIPLTAYFVVLQRRPSFEPRYMMLVTPALYLLLAWGVTQVRNPFSPRKRVSNVGVGLAAVIMLSVLGWGIWSYFTDARYFKDDSAGVAHWLAVETTSRDIVYVDVPHPFHYYAARIPAPTRYLFVDVHTAADTLNAEAAGRNRAYWVTWRGSDTDPRGVISFLLDKAGRRAGEIDFRGYHLAWWNLPPGAHFSLPTDLSPADVIFGDVARLDGLAFAETAQVGKSAWATLHFTLLRATGVDYRVSLRLRDAKGNLVTQTDRDLLNDRHFRTSAWPLDDPRLSQAINVYTLPIPPSAPTGDYCLEVVVYGTATLGALPVAGASPSGCAFSAEDGFSVRLGMVTASP